MTTHDAVDPKQVASKPWYETAAKLDRADLVQQVIGRHPTKNADEIVDLLAKEHVEVSATLVMQEMARLRPRPTAE
jgi:hypothetical protein